MAAVIHELKAHKSQLTHDNLINIAMKNPHHQALQLGQKNRTFKGIGNRLVARLPITLIGKPIKLPVITYDIPKESNITSNKITKSIVN